MRSLRRRSRISKMEILILALVLILICYICGYSYVKIYKVVKDIKRINVDLQLLEKQLEEEEADLEGSPHQQGSEVNEQS